MSPLETKMIGDRILRFYADESWIEIEGKKHLMLGAIGVEVPGQVEIEVVQLKKKLGLKPLDEIKWNSGRSFSEEDRHQLSLGMLYIIRKCTGFICIAEGDDKQSSAQLLFRQVFEYCARSNVSGYVFCLDRGLLNNEPGFLEFLKTFGDPRLAGFQVLDSSCDQLIQCADFFVGFYRTAIRQLLGQVPTKTIKLPTNHDEMEEWTLPDYVIIGTRGMLWAEARSSSYDAPPTRHSMGMGFRVHSSISESTLKLLERQAATVYMGCLH